MADVLTVLSDCVKSNKQMKEINGKICLGGKYFPKDIETTFPIRQLRRNKMSHGRKFYNLGEVYYFYFNQSMSHEDYVRKAQEKNMIYVLRPDRNPLLKRIHGRRKTTCSIPKSASQKSSESTPSHRTSSNTCSSLDSCVGETMIKKPRMDRSINMNERVKVRTYSRNRSSQDSRMSLRRQSLNDEDQPAFTVSSTNNDDFDELPSLKSEVLHLETTLKTMTTFLKDYMGLSDDQLQVLQDGSSSSDELNDIASHVKNKIIHTRMALRSDSPSPPLNVTSPKYCYKAVKHPIRGWEMIKEDLLSVLSGYSVSNFATEIKDHQSKAIEECLAKGTVQLKRAFSVIIAQIREFNKSHEESDTFCEKVVKDCLIEAVDSFRDMFKGLLSSGESDSHEESVEKWVEMSRAELGKLFQSLAMTLQSLQDIPASTQNPPLTLFHLPEPTFSLALNPAKVTHSVVLEMYVRIGLAELRQILMLLMGVNSDPPASICSNGNHGKTSKRSQKSMLKEANVSPSEHNEKSMNYLMPSTSSFPCSKIFDLNPGYNITLPQKKEKDEICEKYPLTSPSTSSSLSNICSLQNPGVFHGSVFRRNGKSKNRNSPYQTRRSSESDYCQYSVFKASLGNTLVSSFKKQIQEKIQASSFHS